MKSVFKSKPLSTIAITGGLVGALVAIPTFYTSEVAADAVSTQIGVVDINKGFSSLVKAVKPAVVNIATTSQPKMLSERMPHFDNRQYDDLDQFLRRFFGDQFQLPQQNEPQRERKTQAVGSGFIISEDGLVVTNHHVIDSSDEIEVVFQDGKRYPATVQGSDEKTDVALLKIDADHPLPYVKFGDSDQAEVGNWVIAIGNPFGLGGSVTSGIVSARGRDINSGPYDDFIQIDAPINRGNSGGPLFNTQGEVVGVNSAIYSPSGGSVGIGFSIPSNMVANIVEQLEQSGSVERGWLGVQIQHVTDEIAQTLGLKNPHGALVSSVVENSPAADAGFQTGDLILTFDGKPVEEMRDLPRLVASTKSAKKVDVEILRNDQSKTLSVVIGAGDSQELASNESSSMRSLENTMGLALSMITPALSQQYSLGDDAEGIIVTDIDPDSNAATRGVRVGDVIKKIGSSQVTSPEDAKGAIKAANENGKGSVLFLLEREGQVLFVAIPIDS